MASGAPTPNLISTFTFGSWEGLDSTYDEITVYRDVASDTCSPTGTFTYDEAAAICNNADQTRYLATLIVTITDSSSNPIECSSWLQYTTSTPEYYTTTLGRPTTPIANPDPTIYPGYVAFTEGASGWNFYLTNEPLMNGFTCQRSACKVFSDCPNYELETTSVTGSYYPLCGCACVAGVGGATCGVPLDCSGRGTLSGPAGSEECACNDPTTLGLGCQGRRFRSLTTLSDDTSYQHEYTLQCEDTPITYYTARRRCAMDDNTRYLASYSGTMSNMQGLAAADSSWVGIESDYDSYSAVNIGGRFNGSEVSTKASYLYSNLSFVVKSSTLSLNHMNTKLSCYICERQTCSKSLDCVEANTESVSGYYPLCTCHCKRIASGPRCEFLGTYSASTSLTTTDQVTLTASQQTSTTLSAAHTSTDLVTPTAKMIGAATLTVSSTAHTITASPTLSNSMSRVQSSTMKATVTPPLPLLVVERETPDDEVPLPGVETGVTATAVIGLGSTPLGSIDSLATVQLLAIFNIMACRVPGVGESSSMRSFLSPITAGTSRYAHVVGGYLLGLAGVVLYGIVLCIVALVVGWARARYFLRHPRLLPLIHQLSFPSIVYESAVLVYGNSSPAVHERVVGSLSLCLCVVSISAYHYVSIWMGPRDGEGDATHCTYCTAATHRIPLPIRKVLVSPTYWCMDTVLSIRSIYLPLRPARVRLGTTHLLWRTFGVGAVCAFEAVSGGWCTVVLSIVTGVCFAHAVFVLVLFIYRIPVLSVTQSLQSVAIGVVALSQAASLGASTAAYATVVLIICAMLHAVCCLCALLIEVCAVAPAERASLDAAAADDDDEMDDLTEHNSTVSYPSTYCHNLRTSVPTGHCDGDFSDIASIQSERSSHGDDATYGVFEQCISPPTHHKRERVDTTPLSTPRARAYNATGAVLCNMSLASVPPEEDVDHPLEQAPLSSRGPELFDFSSSSNHLRPNFAIVDSSQGLLCSTSMMSLSAVVAGSQQRRRSMTDGHTQQFGNVEAEEEVAPDGGTTSDECM